MTATVSPQRLRATVSLLATKVRVVHESRCPEIGPICQVRDEPPNLHDQSLVVGELRGLLEYGFSDTFSAELQVPVKLTDTSIIFRRLDGTPFEPDYGNIHHRNETLFGFGDVWLSLRGQRSFGDVAVGARAGVSLPTGRTEENPFELGEAGIEHQHIQLGTGTFDPLLGLDVTVPAGPIGLRAYGQAQLVLYENGQGYRAGHRYGAGALGSAPLNSWLSVSAGLDLIVERPERWDGAIRQDGNLGRTDLLAGAAATFLAGAVELTVGLKVPVYQHVIQSEVEPGELTYPGLLMFSASRVFQLGQ